MNTNKRTIADFEASVKDKNVAVVGVGVSNRPLIDMLLRFGATVTARDKKPRESFHFADELEALGVRLILGEDYLCELNEDIIFKAPGIRRDIAPLREAEAKGALITSEMEVFFEICPAHIFGITGSDGKTTTTTLISKLLEAEGRGRVFLGGNIGRPLLPLVSEMTAEDFAVVELSSFQLHNMPYSPEVALITNVSPNHLDWHTGIDEYIEAKMNIFKSQKSTDRLVLNLENDVTRKMAESAPTPVSFFAHREKDDEGHIAAVYDMNGTIYCCGEPILEVSDIVIPGRHNVENYMAAIAATRGFVSQENIRTVARTFTGVEHRCELVRTINGVRYFNSSIDSSPTRCAAALSNFTCPVIAICGGYDKHIPFDPLGYTLSRHARVAVLTGATAAKIKAAILACPEYDPDKLKIIEEPDFTEATLAASREAKEGEVVILSPACASFDAFPNFEVRGRRFKDIVNGL